MSNPTTALLRANLKQLKLPTMLAEFDKLAREAAEGKQTFEPSRRDRMPQKPAETLVYIRSNRGFETTS
jgi:hypothetical protein